MQKPTNSTLVIIISELEQIKKEVRHLIGLPTKVRKQRHFEIVHLHTFAL